MKSMCCQGDLAIVPAVQDWEKEASGKSWCGGVVSDGAGIGLCACSPAEQVLQDFLQALGEGDDGHVRCYHVLGSICGCKDAFFG